MKPLVWYDWPLILQAFLKSLVHIQLTCEQKLQEIRGLPLPRASVLSVSPGAYRPSRTIIIVAQSRAKMGGSAMNRFPSDICLSTGKKRG